MKKEESNKFKKSTLLLDPDVHSDLMKIMPSFGYTQFMPFVRFILLQFIKNNTKQNG
jgi:hypothetical protein